MKKVRANEKNERRLLSEVMMEVKKEVKSESYKERNKTAKKHFTRSRKLGFVAIIMFLLNLVKKAVQIELDKYMEIQKKKERISQQALSKARQHIRPEAFKEILEISQNKAMKSDELKRYKGYRLFGIDGTLLNIEHTSELTAHFGIIKNKGCRARASILCELSDGIIIDASLEKFATGERQLALRHIKKFSNIKGEKDILIFDRGYISRELIAEMTEVGINFIIRVPRKYNTEIDKTNKADFFVTLKYEKKNYNVRVIKVDLESEPEVLITNLPETEFKAHEFKSLYFKRWPIETKYNMLKNKLKIETLSGKTLISLYQDFYAIMFISNIVSMAKMSSDEIISEDNEDKELKYEYKTNENVLINKLKDRLVLALLTDNDKKSIRIINSIVKDAAKNRIPIKPNRRFPRLHESLRCRRRALKKFIKSCF